MKNKNLIVMASLTVLALGYAVYDFQSEKRADEKKAEASRLFAYDRDQVSQIEIQTREIADSTKDGTTLLSNKIKLVRTQEGWKIEEPIQETAEQNSVQDFLDGLLSEKSEEVASESSGPVDWKVFGLDAPRGTITLNNNLGESTTVAISAKKNYQGDAFLRRNQEAKVLLGAGTWFSKLEKKAVDFRDKRILHKQLAMAKELQYQSDSDKFTLKFEDQKWTSAEKPAWKLDQNKIRDFLQVLANPSIIDFVKESTPSPEELKKWGFQNPRATLNIVFRDDVRWSAKIAQDADKYDYVQMSDPAFVVKIPSSDATKLAVLRLDTLRDRREPFEFKRQDIKKIEFHSAQGTTELELKGGDWEAVKKSREDLKIDSQKVGGLLIKLGGLEVSQFLDKKENLGKSARQVLLKNEKGETVFELSLGDEQKKKINGQDRNLILAQSNLFPEVVTLDQASVRALGIDEYWGVANQKAKTESENR